MRDQKPPNDQVSSEGNQLKNEISGSKNTTVSVGRDNTGNITIYNWGFPSIASIGLAAISLLADLAALGQLAYNIIVKNQVPDINIIYQLIAIVLVFSLGYGLGVLGMRGLQRDTIYKILRIYVWAYLILACLSYLAVIATFRAPYTFGSYITYIVIVALQIAAFMILRSVSQVKAEMGHPVALMTVAVIHALIFLYNMIYVRIPDLLPLLGEWVFWFGWTMFAVPMFRSALSSGNADRKSGSKFR